MNINIVNYNNPEFYLFDFNDEIVSYSNLKNLIEDTNNNITERKKELHGIIVARPADIFIGSEENGTVLEQLNEKENEIIENLNHQYNILNNLNIIKDNIEDYAVHYITNDIFNKYKEIYKCDTKYDLAFMLLTGIKNPNAKDNDKYYNNNNLTLDPFIPVDKSISGIVEHASYNINSNNYNIVNELQANVKYKNIRYIAYVKQVDGNYLPFIGKNNQLFFNTYNEAEDSILKAINLYSADFGTFEYIKNHKELFDINNKESFVYPLANSSDTKCQSLFSNILINIIYNVISEYCKFEKEYQKDELLELINKSLDEYFINKYGVSKYNDFINFIKEHTLSGINAITRVVIGEDDRYAYNEYFNSAIKYDFKYKYDNKQLLDIENIKSDDFINIVKNIFEHKISTLEFVFIYLNSYFNELFNNNIYKIKKIKF